MAHRYTPPQELCTGNIRLDTNEVPYEIPIDLSGIRLNVYRSHKRDEFRQALAAAHGVHEENIVIGNGSSHILDTMIRLYGERGVAAPDPTYRQYRSLTEKTGYPYIDVPLQADWSVDVEDFQYDDTDQLALMSNPNNPTGKAEPLERIEQILRYQKQLTIVDEAYGEFDPAFPSATPLVKEGRNIATVHTFSKAYAAAAVRLGYAVASQKRVREIESEMAFYPDGELHHHIGLQLLAQQDTMHARVNELIERRSQTEAELNSLGFEVLPSSANFLLVKPPQTTSAAILHAALLERGIVVRNMEDQQRVADYLRVTIGSQDDMTTFIESTREILAVSDS